MLSYQETLAWAIQRHRQKSGGYLSLPKTYSEVFSLFLDSLRSTAAGKEFIRYMETVDGDTAHDLDLLPPKPLVLVFLSPWGKEFLTHCVIWLCDGTFETVPHPFYQVGQYM